MATVLPDNLLICDGFRLESPEGMHGWVEETWLGPGREPAALAIRLIDGRRGLLLVEDVETVVAEHELVRVRRGGRLLELDAPRVRESDGGPTLLSASWRTTGATLELPRPPGPLRYALLLLRPWRLAPPPRHGERPVWQLVGAIYMALALIVGFVIGLAFLIAWLLAGSPY
jgi:hypothetical protein